MTFTDILALTALSLLGLAFWFTVAIYSRNVEEVAEILDKKNEPTRMQKFNRAVFAWTTYAMVFVPWLLMTISVAQRILGA